MKKTVAVTVYVDVQVDRGGRKECERVAKMHVLVADGAAGGLNGGYWAKDAKRPKKAVCVD